MSTRTAVGTVTLQDISDGPPGQPGASVNLAYNDLDTTGNAGTKGRYVLSAQVFQPSGTYANGITTNFAAAQSFLIHKNDTANTDHTNYLNTLSVNDTFVFWVSARRWYQFRIVQIDASPPSNKFNFGIEFLAKDIADGETAISTAPGTDVVFKFAKERPSLTYHQDTTPVGASINELWYNPDTNLVKRYNGSTWDIIAEYLDDPAARINARSTTIDGGKITTNSIDTEQLAANSVTTQEIGAGAITAGKIQSGQLHAGLLRVTEDGNDLFSVADGKATFNGEVVFTNIVDDGHSQVPISFYEDFASYSTIEELHTKWESCQGSGEVVFTADGLCVGDDTGNDQRWYIWRQSFRLEEHAQYRMKIIVRRPSGTIGTGRMYCGFAGRNEADDQWVNTSNSNATFSSMKYFAAAYSLISADGNWHTYEGIHTTGRWSSQSGSGTPVETATKFRPLFLVNYPNTSGITEIKSVEVEKIPSLLQATDVGAREDTWTPTAADVGAREDSWTPTAADVGAREDTWTPTATEVGAREDTWLPTGNQITSQVNTTATTTINGGKITTNSITASKIAVASRSGKTLNRDPNFTDEAAWSAGYSHPQTFGNHDWVFSEHPSTPVGTRCAKIDVNNREDMYSEFFPIDPTKNYRVSVQGRRPTSADNRTQYLLVSFRDSNNDRIPGGGSGMSGWTCKGTHFYFGRCNQKFPTTYTSYTITMGPESTAGIPSTARSACIGILGNYSGNNQTNTQIADYRFEEIIPAELIVDGTITAAKIAADAVTADKINVSSLAAVSANIGTVTAGKVRSQDDAHTYVDLNATGYEPFIKVRGGGSAASPDIKINANGSGEFKRVLLSKPHTVAYGRIGRQSGDGNPAFPTRPYWGTNLMPSRTYGWYDGDPRHTSDQGEWGTGVLFIKTGIYAGSGWSPTGYANNSALNASYIPRVSVAEAHGRYPSGNLYNYRVAWLLDCSCVYLGGIAASIAEGTAPWQYIWGNGQEEWPNGDVISNKYVPKHTPIHGGEVLIRVECLERYSYYWNTTTNAAATSPMATAGACDANDEYGHRITSLSWALEKV